MGKDIFLRKKMKFKIIIDKDCEEEIVAKVHYASDLTRNIDNLVVSYTGNNELCVQGDCEIKWIRYEEIECITIIDRRLFVIDFFGTKYRISGTLSEIEEKLPSYFIRINKSTLVNEKRIACFKTTFSGAVDALLKSGFKDYVSRRCFAKIKRRYDV